MKIAVLAVQGAFLEHEKMLENLGAEVMELRKAEDLAEDFDGLVLPGGESTVQGKLLRELELFAPIKKRIQEGMPVLATCAGLILLAERISNDRERYFATLPVTVRRNAYGRQLGSFYAEEMVKGIGRFPMEFIRAPYIERTGENVEVLGTVDGNIVAVQFQNQMGVAFHPELTGHEGIHRKFLELVRSNHTLE